MTHSFKRGDMKMAFEVVKNIVEAEKEVDVIKTKALMQAEEIKKQAEEKAIEMISETKRNAKQLREKAISEAVTKSKAEAEIIIAEAKVQCEKLRSASLEKKDRAVKAVIGKVVGINGDS